MMLQELLNDWKGEVEISDKRYKNVKDAESVFKSISDSDSIKLKLYAKSEKRVESSNFTSTEESKIDDINYRITVKKYMTEKASPEFDFMAKWNNDNPMPLRTMTGTIEKETRGMVYMKLHGQAESVVRCMRCGRLLTNPTSKLYGIGPECITKVPVIMNLDVNDIDGIKKKLTDITWEGWIIKSAITEKVEVSTIK